MLLDAATPGLTSYTTIGSSSGGELAITAGDASREAARGDVILRDGNSDLAEDLVPSKLQLQPACRLALVLNKCDLVRQRWRLLDLAERLTDAAGDFLQALRQPPWVCLLSMEIGDAGNQSLDAALPVVASWRYAVVG